VQEIADRLAIGPERVSDEKYKAIRKLRTHFQAA
jgi:DNA-binding CsgD family transcriptional regulator